MVRQSAMGVVIALLTTASLTAGVASASPTKNTTSITLTCDKNTGSTATLTLQQSISQTGSLADVTIKCGLDSELGLTRNRVSIPTGAVSAGYVTVTSWTVTTSSVDCASAEAISFKGTCPQSGSSGAQLVVR